jgi:hypothetical protein
MQPGKVERREFEYRRHGTQTRLTPSMKATVLPFFPTRTIVSPSTSYLVTPHGLIRSRFGSRSSFASSFAALRGALDAGGDRIGADIVALLTIPTSLTPVENSQKQTH